MQKLDGPLLQSVLYNNYPSALATWNIEHLMHKLLKKCSCPHIYEPHHQRRCLQTISQGKNVNVDSFFPHRKTGIESKWSSSISWGRITWSSWGGKSWFGWTFSCKVWKKVLCWVGNHSTSECHHFRMIPCRHHDGQALCWDLLCLFHWRKQHALKSFH